MDKSSKSPHDPNHRKFSDRQRIALFVAADGHCSSCGVALSRGWHADHIEPYSRGGATDVLNGQALCPRCNIVKGNRVESFREWQSRAIKHFNQERRTDYLCSATPGSGKTRFALEIARQVLQAQRVQRVVVVVPTTHLKRQWCREASRIGIELDPDFTNAMASGETSDFKGCCVTYQQVGTQPELHRILCRLPTMVILDEIHHAGDQKSWGDALKTAFGSAVLRLSLTGTPFREDGKSIPFVRYDEEGRCIVDVSYGYGDALRDGAVRNIIFPTYEGNMEWWSGARGEMTASFADEIPSEEEGRRLRTALDPQGEWIRDVIRQADARLLEIRKSSYPSAAGLLIAIDKAEARKIASLMRDLLGIDPVVALSDDADASRKIHEFGNGKESAPRWLIAVRMVSEGVDIPRLFVGVWATNTLTNLFFRQVVGRFVRLIAGVEDQTGYLFIPRVDRLIEYVETIKIERDSALRLEDDEEDEGAPFDGDPYTRPPSLPDWAPYSSTAIEDATYIGDEAFQPSEMQRVREFIIGSGLEGASPATVALIVRRWQAWGQSTSPQAAPQVVAPLPVETVPASHQREQLRRKVRNLVSRFIQAQRDSGVEVDQKTVYLTLMRHQGTSQPEATIEQLKERIQILSEWIDGVSHAHR